MASKARVKRRRWVKHVIQEGSREHVLRWDYRGTYCSNKDCEVNREKRLT